eukprot:TRINITY_DN1175_c0_g1_i1.p1 TRINITY_DN1175_c0_g1~~TRINITY_DN1175_c0_g1_i1.p1  ORF type:complete len:982 (-),score=176.23 TRINITY_DN1175_c0_g1_i1:2548-5289(-)
MQVAADHAPPPPQPSSPSLSVVAPTQTPRPKQRRRGRPRSPVFTYFRRLVDQNGLFVGNQCTFCSFVSRDRSENPTYLTRHIIRTCSAPQHVKDVLSARFVNTNAVLQHAEQAGTVLVSSSPLQQTTVVLSTAHPNAHNSSKSLQQQQSPQPTPDSSQPIQSLAPVAQSAASFPALVHQPQQQQSQLRPLGITKSRRGRPRSPALLHFRRHIDENGVFIANQCIHCSFVSRDRSENSTLLLRHLLSPSCCAPEDVRQMLRANKGASKTVRKRTIPLPIVPNNLVNASSSSALHPHVTRHSLVVSVLRFLLVNDLPFSVVENPLFHDFLHGTRGVPAISDAASTMSATAHPNNNAHSQITYHELETFLSNRSATELVHEFDHKPQQPYSSAQLIIYFADNSREAAACCSDFHAQNDNPVALAEESAAYLASVFCYVSASHLSYLFSKNCRSNFSSSVAEIVQLAQKQCDVKCEQIVVSRPLVAVDKPRAIPRSELNLVWLPDIVREVDILCQELLAQVPLLIRVQRRNNILAAYFREDYSKAISEELFGRSDGEKETFQRYLDFISKRAHGIRSCQVVDVALHTHDLLCKAQVTHEDAARVVDTRNFITTLTEETCGNVSLSQEVIRLVLSSPYRDDLNVFVSVMKPLTALISLYRLANDAPTIRYSSPLFDFGDLFRCPLELRTRSLAHVLPDCVGTLRELYSEKFPQYEDDLRLLRGHVACRLLGKGVDGCPPVADDISYIAALLNPNGDLSNTKGITVDEVWKRAVQYVQAHHSENGEVEVKTVLDQLQEFQNRRGRFADDNLFSEASESTDPLEWWETKCAHVAPELHSIAQTVLSVPTTAFAAVRHMTNFNACGEDLQRSESDAEMEKRRFITWNLRLCMSRTKAGEKEESVAEGGTRCTRLKTERVLL